MKKITTTIAELDAILVDQGIDGLVVIMAYARHIEAMMHTIRARYNVLGINVGLHVYDRFLPSFRERVADGLERVPQIVLLPVVEEALDVACHNLRNKINTDSFRDVAELNPLYALIPPHLLYPARYVFVVDPHRGKADLRLHRIRVIKSRENVHTKCVDVVCPTGRPPWIDPVPVEAPALKTSSVGPTPKVPMFELETRIEHFDVEAIRDVLDVNGAKVAGDALEVACKFGRSGTLGVTIPMIANDPHPPKFAFDNSKRSKARNGYRLSIKIDPIEE